MAGRGSRKGATSSPCCGSCHLQELLCNKHHKAYPQHGFEYGAMQCALAGETGRRLHSGLIRLRHAGELPGALPAFWIANFEGHAEVNA